MARQVSNKKQMAKLVELMEKHPTLGKGILAKNMRQTYWDRIAVQLNSLGPPKKSWEKWYKVWIDMKNKTKTKITHNRNELQATGGGPNTLCELSPLESAVDDLLNITNAVDPPGIEYGANTKNSNMQLGSENAVPVLNENIGATISAEPSVSATQSTGEERRCVRSRRAAEGVTRMSLLELQTKSQKEFHEQTVQELKNITAAVKGMGDAIKDLSSQQTKFMKSLIEIKKEEMEWAKKLTKNE